MGNCQIFIENIGVLITGNRRFILKKRRFILTKRRFIFVIA